MGNILQHLNNMTAVSVTHFNLVYDVLSFSMGTMMATTIFLWMRVSSAAEKYKSALIISGLVTFIAAYHYIRIFNSWCEAYAWQKDGTLEATGVPFNDAYRYMDWLLTVPLLLIEIILVMKTLLVGLNDATNSEEDPEVRRLVKGVQWWTVISWCTYPVVYIFPMFGIKGANVVVFIQLGYSVSDIISKCGVGLMIYQITMAKSAALNKGKNEETPLYG